MRMESSGVQDHEQQSLLDLMMRTFSGSSSNSSSKCVPGHSSHPAINSCIIPKEHMPDLVQLNIVPRDL